MNCKDHKNEELAHCPSCLANYWECRYKEKSEQNTELQKALTELGEERDQYHAEVEHQKKVISKLADELQQWVPCAEKEGTWIKWAEQEVENDRHA